ncbi:MAG: hypothetical protein JWQ80_1461 [Massilia sp.]|nr:hypothetical protein [Massilia sp.]
MIRDARQSQVEMKNLHHRWGIEVFQKSIFYWSTAKPFVAEETFVATNLSILLIADRRVEVYLGGHY